MYYASHKLCILVDSSYQYRIVIAYTLLYYLYIVVYLPTNATSYNGLLLPGDTIQLRWNPSDIAYAANDPAELHVNISLSGLEYYAGGADEEAVIICLENKLTLASNIENTGVAIVEMPYAGQDVCNGICPILLLVQPHTSPPRQVALGSDVLLTFLDKATSLSTVRYLLCQVWLAAEPASIGQEILDKVIPVAPCPPLVGQAEGDDILLVDDSFLIPIFHPGAAVCYRQNPNTFAE